MGKPLDLEALRAVFADPAVHIALGTISQLSLADDRSGLKALVSLFPNQREMVCRMTWEAVGPESGIFAFPEAGDLVLVAFAEGDANQAFVIRRLTSREEKIPERATEGDTVVKARSGKRSWLTGDELRLSRGDDLPTEPLVLGNVLKELLGDLLQAIATHTHTSAPPGVLTTPPTNVAEFTALQTSPVNDAGILSDFAYTEK